jgi:glutathione S-transferase
VAKELVSDELWDIIEPLLPPEPPKPGGGRPRVDDRAALTGIIFVQYSHEPNVAVPRAWAHFGVEMTDERKKALEQKRRLGYAALGVMEGHLRRNDFFVSNRYSIADIALYAYTHVADEGGFDLGRFPAIGAWMELVRAQPGHVPITWDRSEAP